MQYVTLNNGVRMPVVGYGVFQITDTAQCRQCVSDALEAGYRLLDTAAAYGNEEAVGAAIRKCGVPRQELFITTKLWVQDASYEGARKAFEVSLEKLGLKYLDLYLIHQPMGDYQGAYWAMEERSVGALCRRKPWDFHPSRIDSHRCQIRQERRTGGPAMECTAGRGGDTKIRPCGNIQRKTKARYVEVLKFWHFVEIGSINGNDHFDRHKTVYNKIPVSVVLDLGVGKTNKNKYTTI